MPNDQLESVKTATEVIGSIIEAAGDSPKVKEAASELGQTALTITKAINNCLLPIAAINFGFEKARKYFSEKFAEDVEEKTKTIPSENLQEPKASIAGPTLQALAFAHEEAALKEMYLELLKTAMDNRVAKEAHPAYVEIIKQLSPEEAEAIKSIIKPGMRNVAIAELRLLDKESDGWHRLATNLLNYHDRKTGDPLENPYMPGMVSNLSRLGLVSISYESFLVDEKAYIWVEKRPEYLEAVANHPKGQVQIVKGIVWPTPLGGEFAKVVGLFD